MVDGTSNFVLDNAIKAYEATIDSELDRFVLGFLKELRKLRSKQEQGLLIELKVPLGTQIWYLSYEEDYEQGWWDIDCGIYSLSWIHYHENKEFYLTRSEAEEALVRMKGE